MYFIFNLHAQEVLTQEFFDYLFQRLGGGDYYSSRKGIPLIPLRHNHLKIDRRSSQRWMKHMQDTLEDMNDHESLTAEQVKVLLNYFKYMASFLVLCQEMNQENLELNDET